MFRRRRDSRPRPSADSSIIKVDVALVDPVEEVGDRHPMARVPLELAAEVARNRDFIASQTSVACSWVANRPHEKGMTYTQSVPVKGCVLTRRAEARMSVNTWD